MHSKTIEVNGTQYVFVNECGDTRHGFYHKSTLLVNGYEVESNKVNYLNRTWESYRFQSAMKGLVSKLMNNEAERLKERYKTEHNISRMTKIHAEAYNEILKTDSRMNDYRALYEAL